MAHDEPNDPRRADPLIAARSHLLGFALSALCAACGSRSGLDVGHDGAISRPDAASPTDAAVRDAGRDGAAPSFDAGPPPGPACEATDPEVLAFHRAIAPADGPIGGGDGYVDVVPPQPGAVSSADALIAALAAASPGDVVFVGASIDLTDHAPVTVPGGVTLAGDRGVDGADGPALFARSGGAPAEALLVTGGPDVRITGLRIEGPDPDRGDHLTPPRGVGTAVLARHAGLRVDNCEIAAFADHAVRLAVADRAVVRHGVVHHVRGVESGVGVFVQGTEAPGARAVVEAMRFDHVRRPVLAADAPVDVEVRRCVVLEHNGNDRVERLGGTGATSVHHDLLLGAAESDLAVRGATAGEVRYESNWTGHDTLDDALALSPAAEARLTAGDNTFGDAALALLPVAEARARPAEGVAPLEVRFDGRGSHERGERDCSLAHYAWRFGDGPVGAIDARGPAVTHRFTEPGRYLVTLEVESSLGLPGRTHVPVLVRPAAPGAWLSLWVKDSYVGGVTGVYRVEVIVDGTRVAAVDVGETDREWQHLVLDVSDALAGEALVEVDVRLAAVRSGGADRTSEINDVLVFVDDVYLFGGRVVNGDFEDGPNGWWLEEVGSRAYLSGSSPGHSRSGDRALVLGVSYVEPASSPTGPPEGSFVSASQRFLAD